MNAIEFNNVSKKYKIGLKKESLNETLASTVKRIFSRNVQREMLEREFWAVKEVDFKIKKGEAVGIIGHNGAGKTTILKLLSRITTPTKGEIKVNGKLSALIEVGAGFHPDLTGRENIYLNGTILGIKRKELDKKFDDIVQFAEIDKFIDTPVKRYSSGMYVRLGFSVAAHMEPEILLIDEVLAVGDMSFQSKCIRKMHDVRDNGVTIIFISHNLTAVESLCSRAILLSGGKKLMDGSTREVIDNYKNYVLQKDWKVSSEKGARYGTGEIIISKVTFTGKDRLPKNEFKTGEPMFIELDYEIMKPVKNPDFGIIIYSSGFEIARPSTKYHNKSKQNLTGKGKLTYTIESLPLHLGQYKITIYAKDETGNVLYDRHDELYTVNVVRGTIGEDINENEGVMYLPGKWNYE